MVTPTNDRPDGKGVLGRDGFLGNLTGAAVTVAGLALVEWLGTIDFSTLPTFFATVAAPAAGLVAGWITTKVLPRYGRRTPRA